MERSRNRAGGLNCRNEDQRRRKMRCVVYALPGAILTSVPQVILDSKTSQRIFELAKDQQDELESVPDDDEEPPDGLSKHRYNLDTLDDEDENDEEEMSEGSVDQEEYAELVCSISFAHNLSQRLGSTSK
jgi:hypothetical protein